jgi:hypothetical protein
LGQHLLSFCGNAAAAAAAGDEILHATQGLLMVSIIRCYDLSDSSKQSSYVSVSAQLFGPTCKQQEGLQAAGRSASCSGFCRSWQVVDAQQQTRVALAPARYGARHCTYTDITHSHSTLVGSCRSNSSAQS